VEGVSSPKKRRREEATNLHSNRNGCDETNFTTISIITTTIY
jgi:hypothetical protein